MTTLGFVSAMTSALVWPALALVLVLVFRRSIKGWMAERPTRFRAGPIEAEWDREAAKVGAAIEESKPGVHENREERTFDRMSPVSVVELVHDSPIGAVMEASKAIEIELIARLTEANITPLPQLSWMIDQAEKFGVISNSLAESLHSLRKMRNFAVHGGAVTATQAVEFVVLAQAVLMQLRGTSWPGPIGDR